MTNQTEDRSKYPFGTVQYSFMMPIAYDKSICCNVVHNINVKEIVFEKATPSDVFDFKWLMTVHLGPIRSIEEVDEIGNAIKDEIFDMLSLILNTKITEIRLAGHGLVPRPQEGGIAHLLLPPFKCSSTGKMGCAKLTSNAIQEIVDIIPKIANFPQMALISLFRNAIDNEEPVVQFLILYLILYDLYETQKKIDENIMRLVPTTHQTLSQYNGRQETIYTRLRNELAHRANQATRGEIINNLSNLRVLVREILKEGAS